MSRLLSIVRAVVHFICCLSLCVSRPVFSEDEVLVSLEQSVERLRQSAARFRPVLDRSQFDLDALLDAKDFAPQSIVDFISEAISLEIYDGALRGAVGTLVSGAGNALDQALLAATLL
jgi:hypothetical protein